MMSPSLPSPPQMLTTGAINSGGSGFGAGGGFASTIMGGAAAIGSGAMALGGMAMRGGGALMGAMAAPFVGGQFTPAGAGQQFGTFGNAGASRSLAFGAGLGFGPNMQGGRMINHGESMRMAGDRGAFKAGEIGLGAGLGLASFGSHAIGSSITMALGGGGAGIGGAAGSMLGGMIGGETGSKIGNVIGTGAGGYMMRGAMGAMGGLAGLGVGTLAAATVGQITDQVGAIRGSGESYGRSAFRFQSPSSMSASGMPSHRERSRFGAGMMNESLRDMSLSSEDMQDIYAGAVEGGMMTGVRNAQDARRRVGQLKETVKTISRELGTTIKESMSAMSEMGAHGIDTAKMGKVISGLGVSGLTRGEAFQGQLDMSSQFAGSGLQGSGMMGAASQSQQLGQTAMRMGLLSPAKIAAMGGAQGVQQSQFQSTTGLMQGGLGQLGMFAGMGRGGMGNVNGNILGAMGQAGANASAGNLLSSVANQTQMTREALNDPKSRLAMMAQVSSMADMLTPPGGNKRDAMKILLKKMGDPNATGTMDMMEAEPVAQKDKIAMLTRQLNDMQTSQAVENFSPITAIKKGLGQSTAGASSSIAGGIASFEDVVSNTATRVRNDLYGINEVVVQKGDVSINNIRKLGLGTGGGMSEKRQGVAGAVPSQALRDKVSKRVRGALMDGDKSGFAENSVNDIMDKFRGATSTKDKFVYALLLRGKLAKGLGLDENGKQSPELLKAVEDEIMSQTGLDVGSAFNNGMQKPGGPQSVISEAELADEEDKINALAGNEVAAGVGALIGGAIGMIGGPAGIAVGAMLGGAIAASIMPDQNFSKIEMASMASDKGRAIAGKIDSISRSNMTDDEKQAAMDNLRVDADAAGIGSDTFDRMIKATDTEDGAYNLMSGLVKMKGAYDVKAITAGVDRAMLGGAGAANEAGLGELGGLMSRGRGGIRDSLEAIGKLSEDQKKAFTEKGGGDWVHASKITADMTKEQILKVTEGKYSDLIDKVVIGADGKLAEKDLIDLQTGVAVAGNVGEGFTTTGAGGAGFTSEQLGQQRAIQAEINQTAEILKATVDTLSGMGIKKTAGGKYVMGQ